MKKLVSSLTMLAAVTLFVVLPAVRTVHAQCSNATLTGTYALMWSGFTTKKAPAGNEVPWAGAGQIAFDGAGNITSTYSTAIDGTIYTSQAAAGTYSVSPDCNGTLTFTSGDAGGVTANLVVASGGAEAFGVITNTGDTVSVDLKRQ